MDCLTVTSHRLTRRINNLECLAFGCALATVPLGLSCPKCLSTRAGQKESHELSQQATLACSESFVAKLAQFFPQAMHVRIPVSISRMFTNGGTEPDCQEDTVIEFGTAREVLFASRLPLEFEDKVRVKNPDGSLDAEALVVAVQFADGQSAVAVRFTEEVANWIIKPVISKKV